ncbi:unnamed protein product [Rhodiola kirilowii]
MAAAQLLFNGERTVVVLFVTRIVLCADSSILYESLALVMLALYALAVEICAEAPGRVSSLKTRYGFQDGTHVVVGNRKLKSFRALGFVSHLEIYELEMHILPGASCGVLLGAITLPAVLASKLIQQSRGYLLRAIELEEFEYLKLQYWATFSCCFSVLSFVADWVLYLSLQHMDGVRLKLLFNTLCDVPFCKQIFDKYFGYMLGLPASVKLVYVVCQGLAAVKVVQYIIYTFPSCASIGEALLVTSGLVHCFGDMVACTVAEICRRLISPGLVSAQFGINRSEISTIIQGTLFGLLIFPILFKSIIQIWGHMSSFHNLDSRRYEIWRTFIFYVLLSFIVIAIMPMWMQFVQEFSLHPILCISKHSKVERILLRKYYHLMAVCMFVPAVIYQPMFLDLAFGAALAVFLVLEIIRICRMWPLGQLVHQFMTAFTDHRDSDILIVSHFSLLLGCALPIWMSSGYNDRPLAPFAGILSLGIGDTMASMVGYKYGVLRWSKAGKKTIEGTAAGITSMLAACLTLLPLLASTGYLVTENWFPLLFAVTVSGLLEAYTAQLDNAFIPLVFYSLLCL